MSKRHAISLLLLPAMLTLGVLFGLGLGFGLLRSFNYMPMIGLTEPNLDAYIALFSAPQFYRSAGLSFYIAGTSTFISAVLALLIAFMMQRVFWGRSLIWFLLQLNLTIPHLVGAIGMVYLISQSGLFARLAYHLDLIAGPYDFPALVYDAQAWGIIILYVFKETPFIVLMLMANLKIIGTKYDSVASVLGANKWQLMLHVRLPLLRPALVSGSVIVFAFTFGAYEIPALLGQNFPQALPVLAYKQFTDVDLTSRPEAMATSIVIVAISLLVILCLIIFGRSNKDIA